jgi:hypothetical protein
MTFERQLYSFFYGFLRCYVAGELRLDPLDNFQSFHLAC